MKVRADVRNLDGRIRPTINGPIAVYVKELTKLGLWGRSPTEVARELVADGIRRLIAEKTLKPIDFTKEN